MKKTPASYGTQNVQYSVHKSPLPLYSELQKWSSSPHILLLYVPFNNTFPSKPTYTKIYLSFMYLIIIMLTNHSVHVCYVSSPYHPSWCDHSDIWLRANIKLLDVQLSLAFLHFLANTQPMEQSPSWEDSNSSAGQGNSPHFMKPYGSLPCSQKPGCCPCPELDQSILPYPICWSYVVGVNILFPATPRSFMGFFPSYFPTKPCNAPLLSLHTCHMSRPPHSSSFDHLAMLW